MRSAQEPAKLLSQLESLIMRFIWTHGEATSESIREGLAAQHPMKDATVRTILRRLEDKGYLTHSVDGRTYVYTCLKRPDKVAVGALRQLLDRFCGGSVEQLLVGMVEQDVISPRELKELADKIDRSRNTKV